MIPLDDYAAMWAAMAIVGDRLPEAEAQACAIMDHHGRYDEVRKSTGVPWWWIGCIHWREASGRFTGHLHNGDPLTARTVHVPEGRPPAPAQPPFTWEASAIDALRGLHGVTWTLPEALRQAEDYNGWGYQRRGLRSPYVWGGTTLQQRGKFVADGRFDADVVDAQIGVAALMSVLQGLGVVLFDPAGGLPGTSKSGD